MATVTGGRLGAEVQAAEYAGVRPAATQSRFWRQLRRDKAMLLLAAPGVLYLLVFVYVPQLGNIIAFQNYVPFLGFASAFVGLDNFGSLFADAAFWSSVRNTVVISGLQLILFFPAPILLALLLNSLISLPVKR